MTTTESRTEPGGDCSPDGGCMVVDPRGARMGHPATILPDAMAALQALGASIGASDLPARTVELINVRVSQINSCGVCLLGHIRAAKKHGEDDERLAVVAGWREAPYFTGAERAALSLAEAMTRMADRADPVPDEVWNEAARHYDEASLAALVVQIASVNLWNRVNVATRQVAGAYEW